MYNNSNFKMPVNISKTNLPPIDERFSYVDLYEVAKDPYQLPYKKCLRKPLRPEQEYLGYAFSIRIHPNNEHRKKYEVPGNETHAPVTDAMRVKYYQYKLGREEREHRIEYKLRRSRRRERFVRSDELAAAPSSALLASIKASETGITIDSVMGHDDMLYSSYDMQREHRVGDEALSQYIFNHFQHLLAQLDPKRVGLYTRKTTDVEKIKKGIVNVYLNIVHDCDRYCAISSLGRFGFVPLREIEKDGLRCVRALLEKSEVDTYKSRLYSVLNKSKGIPYEGGRLYPDMYYAPYVAHMQDQTFGEEEAHLVRLPRPTGAMDSGKADTSHAAVVVIGCVLPAVVMGTAVAYIVRSSSKFAQSVRNKISNMTYAFRGMQRVVTHYEDKEDKEANIELE